MVCVTDDNRPYFHHLNHHDKLDMFNEDRRSRNKFPWTSSAMRNPQARDLPHDWISQHANDSLLEEEFHTDGFVGMESEEWLKRACSRRDPFFLQVNFHGPHDPYDPPALWAETFRDADVPPAIPPSEQPIACQTSHFASDHAPSIKQARRQYTAVTSMIDHRIGRLLDILKSHGKLENTLIIFASDHGDLLGDFGLFTKGVPYDGCLRVPMMMTGPGIPAGETSHAIIELADLYPTILEMTGIPAPPHLTSTSFVPVIKKEETNIRNEALAMQDYFVCLRSDNWKYILYVDGTEEFYDLASDPEERKNMISSISGTAQYQQVKTRLRKRIGTTWAGAKPDWWDQM